MKEISGANPDLLGQVIGDVQESGKAIELRQSQGMKVVEVMFDNFNRTQKLLALGLVDMVRFTDVYTDDELKAIAKIEDAALLKGRRTGRYGIEVEPSSTSPTAKYSDFTSILEIAKMYPDRVPAEVVVENSGLVNREDIIDKLEPASGEVAGK